MVCIVDPCHTLGKYSLTLLYGKSEQGRGFAKQVVGTELVKTAQSTINILEVQISPRI